MDHLEQLKPLDFTNDLAAAGTYNLLYYHSWTSKGGPLSSNCVPSQNIHVDQVVLYYKNMFSL